MATPTVCPECRTPVSVGIRVARCPEHGLYGLTQEALASLADHPLLGQSLDGKYGLLDVLGRGGTGSVYRGVQEPLGRPVAVKLLHATLLAGREGRERFEREARALSGLTSPHTVRLLDYGVTREGPATLRNLAYLVMELLEGETLQERMRRAPLSLEEISTLVEALADSLDEAHAAGIVHRDLKPSNVVLTQRRDGRAVAKLIDFGVAREEGVDRTQPGRVSGTPLYMAPEQARGDVGQGPTLDVYALGGMVYELLTGRPPYAGTDPFALLMAHCQAPVPRLPEDASTPALSGLAPDALARLDRVIRRALAKAPEDRHPSVGALRDAWRLAVGRNEAPAEETWDGPVEAPAPGGGAPMWGSRGWVLALAGAAILALVVGAMVTRGPGPAPTTEAYGVVQPAAATPTASPVAPLEAPVSAAPVAPSEAPDAAAPPPPTAPARSSARSTPAPASARAAIRVDQVSVPESRRLKIPVPAGRWQVEVTVVGGKDSVEIAWEPAGCPTHRGKGVRHALDPCVLQAPATLVVENPINLFGDDLRISVRIEPK